jgi:hypothetical protein
MRAEHRPEHLLVDVVGAPAHCGAALAHAAFDLSPLRREAPEACISCGSLGRRLWHGVCAWCGADLEELEALEQE